MINSIPTSSLHSLPVNISSIDMYEHKARNSITITSEDSIFLRKIIDNNIDMLKKYTPDEYWPSITNPISAPLWGQIGMHLMFVCSKINGSQNELRDLHRLSAACLLIQNHMNIN